MNGRNGPMPTGALTEGALMVALSELLFVAGRYLPGGFVVAFFGALPLALLAFRRGPKTGALGAAAALLLLFVLAGPSGVSLSAPHAASGPLMGALLRAGRGTPACALAGAVVRLLYYPPVFFFYVYLVLGGVEAFVDSSGELLNLLDRSLGTVVGVSLSSIGPMNLFVLFLALWSVVAGVMQAVAVSLFIRRILASFLDADRARSAR